MPTIVRDQLIQSAERRIEAHEATSQQLQQQLHSLRQENQRLAHQVWQSASTIQHLRRQIEPRPSIIHLHPDSPVA